MDKTAVRLLLKSMPEGATWEDLTRAIRVLKVLAAGVADRQSGQVYSAQEIREKYGLSK
jgi:hypothetical protein